MNPKSLYNVPVNIKLFRSNFNYYNGIGKFSNSQCIDKSLHIAGTKKVNHNEYEEFIQCNQLSNIFKMNNF